ncbi:MAG: hemerythrin domain-containing protein [Bdellovibrionales bacterium]|nr:hemerythrin domain-containing protein [Bdellovibrionales bacterium]
MENVLTLIKKDHDAATALFAELRRLIDADTFSEPDVRECFQNLKRALLSHQTAEEEAVYSRLRTHGEMKDYAFEGETEHDLAAGLLEKMTYDSPIDERWRAQLAVLKHAVDHHVEEEELDLFPMMKKAFSPDELVEMGKDLQALKLVVQETGTAPLSALRTDAGVRGARPGAEDDIRAG